VPCTRIALALFNRTNPNHRSDAFTYAHTDFIMRLFVNWKWACAVGFIAPLLRFAIFSMPPMPFGIAMAFELATYGLVTSLLYNFLPKKRWSIYASLISAMVIGRVVWGAARMVIAGVTANPFTWQMFIGGALLEAIPGIIIQLVLIPIIVMAVKRNNEV